MSGSENETRPFVYRVLATALRDINYVLHSELVLWAIVGVFVGVYSALQSLRDSDYLSPLLQFQAYAIGTPFLLLPIVFQKIFGAYPLQAFGLKLRRREGTLDAADPKATSDTADVLSTAAIAVATQTVSIGYVSSDHQSTSRVTSEEVIRSFALSSEKLAERIFSRAGVYMMTGVIIAFVGLAFFYAETLALPKIDKEMPLSSVIILQASLLIPRLGMLLFIEFFAFFFLRQYRSAMEEFRYFEAIKRKREEVYSLVHLMQTSRARVDMADLAVLVEGGVFFSTPPILAAGQTTEILETKKLTKDETELFSKLIETIAGLRK